MTVSKFDPTLEFACSWGRGTLRECKMHSFQGDSSLFSGLFRLIVQWEKASLQCSTSPALPLSQDSYRIQPTDWNHTLAFNQLELTASSYPAWKLFGSILNIGTLTSGARRKSELELGGNPGVSPGMVMPYQRLITSQALSQLSFHIHLCGAWPEALMYKHLKLCLEK